MNSLTTGILLLLYLVLSNGIAVFIEQETSPPEFITGCNVNDNLTTCDEFHKTSLLEDIFEVSVGNLSQAPDWVQDFWLLINVTLLTLAIALIVSFFIGLVFGGAS